MAQYKVDNRILSEAEYQAHRVELWGTVLFIAGAITTGVYLHDMLPEAWSKNIRFSVLIVSCIMSGTILAHCAGLVRNMFFLGLFLAILYGIGSWLWSII